MKKTIVDVFVYFGPTDRVMLELRINLLKNYVDKFVIGEANKTHSGIPIEYTLKKTIEELNLPKEMIDVVEIDVPENDVLEILELDRFNCYEGNDKNINAVRGRARDRINKDFIHSVLDNYPDDTVFMISDCDEIINPIHINWFSDMVLKTPCNIIKVPLVHLEGRADLRVFMKDSDTPKLWDGALCMCTKHHLKITNVSNIRSNIDTPFSVVYVCENNNRVEDSGWHFSWMGNSEVRKTKRKSFCHYDDQFSWLAGGSYQSEEITKVMEDEPEEGKISVSGDKNTILKKYPLNLLPTVLFELPTVKKYLLPNYSTENLKDLNPIPVIGVPIVNGVHWLKRLILSVDYPTENFVIFNNNGKGEITEELNELVKMKHEYIQKITLCHLPSNIGCAGAYNMVIKCFINAPYWIITNNDVAFVPGFLGAMSDAAQDTETGMVFGQTGEFGIGSWDLFLMKDWVVQKYGLFDDNFYPAYAEDLDYEARLSSNPIKKVFLNLPYYHGETTSYSISGSQTWRTDLNLKEKMFNSMGLNEKEYMTKKWGERWRYLDTYKSPFNNEHIPITYTSFDLNFARRKYPGF